MAKVTEDQFSQFKIIMDLLYDALNKAVDVEIEVPLLLAGLIQSYIKVFSMSAAEEEDLVIALKKIGSDPFIKKAIQTFHTFRKESNELHH